MAVAAAEAISGPTSPAAISGLAVRLSRHRAARSQPAPATATWTTIFRSKAGFRSKGRGGAAPRGRQRSLDARRGHGRDRARRTAAYSPMIGADHVTVASGPWQPLKTAIRGGLFRYPERVFRKPRARFQVGGTRCRWPR